MVDNQDTPLAQPLAGEAEPSEAGAKTTTPVNTDQVEAEAETGEPDEAEEADELDEEEGEQPKKTSGSARRKAQLEAERAENARLRAEVERLRSNVPLTGDKAGLDKAVIAEIGPPPKESDYSDYLAYERAATAYELDKRIAERNIAKEAARNQSYEVERIQRVVEAHKAREVEVRKAIPDYDAVLRAATFEVAPHLQKLIIESDKSAEVAYYLAKRPKLAAELNTSNPIDAARRIGRIEASVSLPKAKVETKAPAVPATLKGGASPAPDPHKAMSMKDYAAMREKQLGWTK